MQTDKNIPKQSKKIGVLSLQGSFLEHIQMVSACGYEAISVKLPEDLMDITHLIIPGGESTVMKKLAKEFGLWEVLEKRIEKQSLVIMGTCAGAILCSSLGMPIDVVRNAYGSQLASGTFELNAPLFPRLQGTFIRAPKIIPHNDAVQALATWPDQNNDVVIAQSGNFFALSFHPELTTDTRIHSYFLNHAPAQCTT